MFLSEVFFRISFDTESELHYSLSELHYSLFYQLILELPYNVRDLVTRQDKLDVRRNVSDALEFFDT